MVVFGFTGSAAANAVVFLSGVVFAATAFDFVGSLLSIIAPSGFVDFRFVFEGSGLLPEPCGMWDSAAFGDTAFDSVKSGLRESFAFFAIKESRTTVFLTLLIVRLHSIQARPLRPY